MITLGQAIENKAFGIYLIEISKGFVATSGWKGAVVFVCQGGAILLKQSDQGHPHPKYLGQSNPEGIAWPLDVYKDSLYLYPVMTYD